MNCSGLLAVAASLDERADSPSRASSAADGATPGARLRPGSRVEWPAPAAAVTLPRIGGVTAETHTMGGCGMARPHVAPLHLEILADH